MIRRSTAIALLLVAASADVALAKRCPNIMFVVDKSGSMLEDPMKLGKKPSKWDLVVSSLTAAVNKYSSRIPFGLVTYSAVNGGGGMTCYQEATLEVECGIGNGPLINQKLQNIMPNGNTNTAEGIRRAINDGKLNDMVRSNYIVLITDGDPNCSVGEPNNSFLEITRAANQKPTIHTFVVGFDGAGGVNPANLNQMAINGQEAIANCVQNKIPCYYSATNQALFLAAIDSIIGGLAGATVLGGCDDSCFSNDCPNGQICTIASVGAAPACMPDPCMGVTCGEGTYCREGHCLKPCPVCLADEECVQESCKPKVGCVLKNNCMGNQVCNPATGSCAMADLCKDKGLDYCPRPSSCDPITGYCVDDACRLVNCPAHSTCFNGYCQTDRPDEPDMSVLPDMAVKLPPDLSAEVMGPVPPRETSCSVGGHGSRGTVLIVLLVGALAGLRRRRRPIA